MALRALILGKRLNDADAAIKAAEARRDELAQQRAALEAREQELSAALEEVTSETPEDERKAVENAISDFEAEAAALETAEAENRAAMDELTRQIESIKAELEEINQRAAQPVKAPEAEQKGRAISMDTRKFFGMSYQERDEFFAREDVKGFVASVRSMMGASEQRGVTKGELLIPTVVLDLIRDQARTTSKLYKHVRAVSVPGKARQVISGQVPEAVWTEMCATLNEINLGFYGLEVDGYKVGAYVQVCNALLQDSDIALASEIITDLGIAIGYALDKAILYGTGTKMPTGIITRLVQTAAPETWPTDFTPWVDLHTTNVITITAANSTGIKLFQGIVGAASNLVDNYSTGKLFWAMNRKTKMTLISEAMNFNANGAIVAGVNEVMPVIGGALEVLDFLPNNVIIGGYGDNYLLAERAGTTIAQSEHYKFVEDRTVFKATARYDGAPVIGGAFVAIGISGATPAANAVSFTADTANS